VSSPGYYTKTLRQGDVKDLFTTGKAKLSASISQLTPVVPGISFSTFDFRLYVPTSNLYYAEQINSDVTLTFTELLVGNLYCLYLPSGAVSTTEQTTRLDINDEGRVLELTSIHGDGPSSFNNTTFRTSAGAKTTSWARRGVAEAKLANEIKVRSFADMRGDYTKRMSGVISSHLGNIKYLKNYDRLTITGGSVTTNYFIAGDRWNVEENRHEILLAEYESVAPTVVVSSHDKDGPLINDDIPPGGKIVDPPFVGDVKPTDDLPVTKPVVTKQVDLNLILNFPL